MKALLAGHRKATEQDGADFMQSPVDGLVQSAETGLQVSAGGRANDQRPFDL
ncbi:hypothetical protein OOT46_16115 [Aquabacterium sp. A7-Y]|nr:hypothetical protein [Aquabacterium sp. A7-Y]MCW7539370.1 hypothetical protein [Aquabacterium sp. A7-Y]